LKLFIKNCGQTAADGDMISGYCSQRIGSRQRLIGWCYRWPLTTYHL